MNDSQGPPSDHEREVNGICRQYERRWTSDPALIGELASEFPTSLRADLFRRLLTIDVENRLRRDLPIDKGIYLRLFPRYAQLIEDAIAPYHSSETATVDSEATIYQGVAVESVSDDDIPKTVGKYQIERLLGSGGFGLVYLGRHPQLDRKVAIKIAKRATFDTMERRDELVGEAEQAARLNHPGIVRVYDIDFQGGQPFIVQEYIEGQDLLDWAQTQADDDYTRRIAAIVKIADAISYAHTQGIFHRDLKPANILVDAAGPHIADFGLAIHVDRRANYVGQLCGTPSYMSPEQIRGETHRLDGRSDIWSLGVILYELLTGSRPFAGDDSEQVFQQVLVSDPVPLRQVTPTVPRDLERICLKCLSKRMADRYSTAEDFVEELQAWSTKAGGDTDSHDNLTSGAMIPRGLRSFDKEDAHFYLSLLPGPRDRDGVPEAVGFWKRKIEATCDEETFRVGLMCGPSGSGKSSILNAGILPRLNPNIKVIHVESHAHRTEALLSQALNRRFPPLTDEPSLVSKMACLRLQHQAQTGQKVLVILDQFEQWLQVGSHSDSELADALRQCDGANLQCIILVRDDFWMAVTRFLKKLEVSLEQGVNLAMVDLFDKRHARTVLRKFGQAYGALPALPDTGSPQNERFLDAAINRLAVDERVISVRIALFAQMIKDKPWLPATMQQFSGTDAIAVEFLDDVFTSSRANPKHRMLAPAAEEVLQMLLPQVGWEIKGSHNSFEELLAASDHIHSASEMEELLDVLDGELRMITPSDADAFESGGRDSKQRYYQLTHDYLVPSIREWVDRARKQTRVGRAEILLEERARLWEAKRESKQLPTWLEWLRIAGLSRRARRTTLQTEMLQKATRFHVTRTALVFVIGAFILIGSGRVWNHWKTRQLVNRLLEGRTEELAPILHSLDDQGETATRLVAFELDKLVGRELTDADSIRRRTHLSLLSPAKSPQHEFLFERLLEVEASELQFILGRMGSLTDEDLNRCWQLLDGTTDSTSDQRIRAAAILVSHRASSPRWDELGSVVAYDLASSGSNSNSWAKFLDPIRPAISPTLERMATWKDEGPARDQAALLLTYFLRHEPEKVVTLIEQVSAPIGVLVAQESTIDRAELLSATMKRVAANERPNDLESAETMGKLCLSAVGLGLNLPDWTFLDRSPDPTVRSYVTHHLHQTNVAPLRILRYIQANARDPDLASRCQALLSSLTQFPAEALPGSFLDEVVKWLRSEARTNPHPEICAAIECLLRQWAGPLPATSNSAKTVSFTHRGARDWYEIDVKGERLRMIIIPEQGWAVSANEITLFQCEALGITRPASMIKQLPNQVSNQPMAGITLDDARRFCIRLTDMEGIDANQACYLSDADGKISVHDELLTRCGYRLPTVDEWFFIAQSGAKTPFFFGREPAWMPRYAYFDRTSTDSQPIGLLLPNDFGLFDIYGNVSELCEDPIERRTCYVGGSFFAPITEKSLAPRYWKRDQFKRAPQVGFRIFRRLPETNQSKVQP